MVKETKLKEVLSNQLKIINPSKEEIEKISFAVKNFLSLLKPELKKIKADVIVGGSFAKKTIIKKKKYDIDFFVRFDFAKYKGKSKELSDILEKALKKIAKNFKPSIKR